MERDSFRTRQEWREAELLLPGTRVENIMSPVRGGDVRQTSVCRWLIAESPTGDKLKFVGLLQRRMY